MQYRNFAKIPTLAVLRAALKYDPQDMRQPLKCRLDFEGQQAGKRLGFKAGGLWLVQLGAGTTYLRNLVWRHVEGSIPAGYKVECTGSVNDNRIANLRLVNKAGEIRWPKSVAIGDRVPAEGAAVSIPATAPRSVIAECNRAESPLTVGFDQSEDD